MKIVVSIIIWALLLFVIIKSLVSLIKSIKELKKKKKQSTVELMDDISSEVHTEEINKKES